jgi:23S rRNA-/tRNA-specific pseudouridylate synthase
VTTSSRSLHAPSLATALSVAEGTDDMTSGLILFQSELFVAADKPAGWLSVPSRWGDRDERRVLGRELEEATGGRLWPVHRLDEEATGLLLFARTAAAHAAASAWFEQRLVGKTYDALTELPPDVPAPGRRETWTSRLLRGKKRAYESPHGKPSETRALLVGRVSVPGGDALHWELDPLTGRPHQLRWGLWRRGCPILGDELYGSQRAFLPGAIALRCVRLRFPADPIRDGGALPDALEATRLLQWMQAGPGPSAAP